MPYFGAINYLELTHGVKGVIEAGVLISFGYLGFEGITRLAEETKNPEKNIPKSNYTFTCDNHNYAKAQFGFYGYVCIASLLI